jgi:hypothetical protein
MCWFSQVLAIAAGNLEVYTAFLMTRPLIGSGGKCVEKMRRSDRHLHPRSVFYCPRPRRPPATRPHTRTPAAPRPPSALQKITNPRHGHGLDNIRTADEIITLSLAYNRCAQLYCYSKYIRNPQSLRHSKNCMKLTGLN